MSNPFFKKRASDKILAPKTDEPVPVVTEDSSILIIDEAGEKEIKEFLNHEFPVMELFAKSYKGKNTLDTSRIGTLVGAIKEGLRTDMPRRTSLFLTCFLSNKERLTVEDDLARITPEQRAKLTSDDVVKILGYKSNDAFVKKKFDYLKRRSPRLIGNALADDGFKHLINEMLSLKDLVFMFTNKKEDDQDPDVSMSELLNKMSELSGSDASSRTQEGKEESVN